MKTKSIVVVLIVQLHFSGVSFARDAARDLKKLVGYTIISSDSVSEVYTKDYSQKFVKLYGGSTFKVDFLLLDPLVMTDVIILQSHYLKS